MKATSPAPTRRALLGSVAAAAVAAAATGCGLRLGTPAPWEPPQPGADEIARQALLTAIAELRGRLTGSPAVAEGDALDASARETLLTGLTAQRDQLRTATEATATSATAVPTEAVGAGDQPGGIVTALSELAAHSAASAVDTSPGLARLVCAQSAWQIAMAQRTARSAPAGSAPVAAELPAAPDLTPSAVPTSDPPDAPQSSDLPDLLEAVLDGERRGAYLSEVLAAGTEDEVRERHLLARDQRRARADELAAWIERGGGQVPAAPVGYQLPSQPLTEADAAALDVEAAEALVTLWVPIAGAADPADRGLGLRAVLDEALRAEALGAELSPAPGLTADAG